MSPILISRFDGQAKARSSLGEAGHRNVTVHHQYQRVHLQPHLQARQLRYGSSVLEVSEDEYERLNEVKEANGLTWRGLVIQGAKALDTDGPLG